MGPLDEMVQHAKNLFDSSERIVQIGKNLQMCTLIFANEYYNFFTTNKEATSKDALRKVAPTLCEFIGIPGEATLLSIQNRKKSLSLEEFRYTKRYLNQIIENEKNASFLYNYDAESSSEYSLNSVMHALCEENKSFSNRVIASIFYPKAAYLTTYELININHIKNFLIIDLEPFDETSPEQVEFSLFDSLASKTILII